MAVVHPSRMALVPPDPDSHFTAHQRDFESPARRSTSPSRERERDREGDYHRSRDRDKDEYKYRRRSMTPPRRDKRERDRERSSRRSSPEYDDYRRRKRSVSPSGDHRPSMYPPRRERNYYGGGTLSADYLESRRVQREGAVANVWPSSPKAPGRALSPKRSHKSSKKHKRSRSLPESLEGSDSSEDDERRRREEKKRRSKRDKERDRKRRRSRSEGDESELEDERKSRRRRRQHRNKRSKTKSETPVSPPPPPHVKSRDRDRDVEMDSHSPSRSRAYEDDGAVERMRELSVSASTPEALLLRSWLAEMSEGEEDEDEDEDDEVGPQPLLKMTMSSNKRHDERAYGGALLRGEGSAMAAFLKEGGTEARIPRRGEIGLTSDQIAAFESVGYVMSGSRHRRMNAVRLRKENQVISAEEKRGILKLQKEERERREAILREEFTELVHDKLKVETRGKVTLDQ